MKRHSNIGILDIQGSVEEHAKAVTRCGRVPVLVKHPEQIAALNGLILPGGESTSIGLLMEEFGLVDAIRAYPELPLWGTCAGAILMARYGWIDIEVERNAYGSQLESFETEISVIPTFAGIPSFLSRIPAIFIRAPIIRTLGNQVKIFATHNKNPILVQQGNRLASTFHPELSSSLAIHQYFIHTVCQKKLPVRT